MKLSELEAKVNAGVGVELVTHLKVTGKEKAKAGLSSGSVMMNVALSGTPNVGYVWGRIIELYGPEQSGKTTLALHAVAEAQRLKLPCMYIDAEHACDPTYMEAIGIDLETLSFVQPDYGEQSLETVIQAAKAGYKLIVVDSVAALTPLAELEGSMGDAHVGRQARMMGQGLRKMAGIVSKHKVIVIFINQIREKVGVMFGNPEVTPGGKALKFFSSYRIEIRSPRGGKIEEKGDLLEDEKKAKKVETGTRSNVKIVKNKTHSPFKTASFNIVYGKGIDKNADAVDYLNYKRVFGDAGRGQVELNGKGYTKKTLLAALKAGESGLKKAVVAKMKEVS